MTDDTTPESTPEAKEKEAVEPADDTLVVRAEKAARRIEEANKTQEALIIRKEALEVEKTLGGKAEAVGKVKEESDSDYADKALAGELE